MENWNKLSLKEKAEYIKVGVKNGLTNIDDIKSNYNKFASGGFTASEIVDGLYENSITENLGYPEHGYNVVYSDSMRKYSADGRGHYPDNVKTPYHPTSPTRGYFIDNSTFELNDNGMKDPNYTIFGAVDNGDSQLELTHKGSTVLPEITVTPKGNYYRNSYDNMNLHADGGFNIGNGSILDYNNIDYRPEGFIDNPEDWYNNGKATQIPKIEALGHKPTFFW